MQYMVLDGSNVRRVQMLKGFLDPCILAVTRARPAYGYEITRRLADAGLADVAEGSVYPALARLEGLGWVRAVRMPSAEGPPRKYYEPTAAGLAELARAQEVWAQVRASIDSTLLGADSQPKGKLT